MDDRTRCDNPELFSRAFARRDDLTAQPQLTPLDWFQSARRAFARRDSGAAFGLHRKNL
jgi:hypothetical protein